MINSLCFLAAGALMSIGLAVIYYEIQTKRAERIVAEKTKKL